VTTVLQYLVIAAVIGLVVFALAVFVFGRGEQLAPLSPRISPTELPERGITGADIGAVRFAMALRGYRMSDVDWALERMGNEIDRLRAEVATLTGDGDASDGGPGSYSDNDPDNDSDDDSDVSQDDDGPVFADAGPTRAPFPQGAPTGGPHSAQITGDS
jgi:DivIVA domain-containing protein